MMNMRWKIAAGLAAVGIAGAIGLLWHSTFKELLTAKPESAAKEPALNGQPLSKIICNNKASASLTLNELLTLKRIITTNDPDIATFELPISYDVITNQRVYPVSLHLLVDGSAGGSNPLGVVQDCERVPTATVCWFGTRTTIRPASTLSRRKFTMVGTQPKSKGQRHFFSPATSVDSSFSMALSIPTERLFMPSCPRETVRI